MRTAEGNGPVNALDRALRAAIGEVHPHLADIELVNFKVRILDEDKGTGAVTRVLLDASDGDQRVGLDRGLRERRRGVLGGAGRLAGARHARRAPRRERRAGDPARPAGRWGGRGAAPCSRCCARAASRSARCSASSSARFAARVGAPHASAVSSGTAGLHLALRAVGRQRRRRGDHEPVLVRRLGQRDRLRARATGVRRHRPAHADDRPGGGRGGGDASARARCCRCTSSAGRPTCQRSSASACRSSRTPARRSARCYADGVAVGARGHPAVFAFYANKQMTTGEGGMVTLGDAALKERIDSERNQGRAPNMDWLDHDRLGFNYRLSEHRLRDRARAARSPRRDARRARARGARSTARRSAAIEGLELLCPDAGGDVRGWFVYTVLLPRGVDRDETIRALRERGDRRASPTCRRST